jgi:hypothetical protein
MPPMIEIGQSKTPLTAAAIKGVYLFWCERRDSNSYALRRWYLKPVRLPIPPLSLFTEARILACLALNRRGDKRLMPSTISDAV